MTAIGLLGDVLLGRKVGERLLAEGPGSVWEPALRDLLAGCDLTVANLECCLAEDGEPTRAVSGKAHFFRAPPAAVGALEAIGAGAVSLANNHSLDFGAGALAETEARLDAAGIVHAGAGADRERARAGAVVECGGISVGIVACSDHHFGFAAGPAEPGIALIQSSRRRGARWRRPAWLLEEIRRLASSCDLVLAFPHWGPNLTSRPARWQRLLARRMVGAGADAVAGHSAHVFHGVGWSRDRPVLFDLGDALHDLPVHEDPRNDLGLIAVWRPGEDPEVELVGLELDCCHSRLARGESADWIAGRLERACGQLGSWVERLDEQRFAVRPRGT